MKLERHPGVAQVWLATPDLSNDTDRWGQFREVVRENAARAVRYTVIYPEEQINEGQLREFRELFNADGAKKRRWGLTELPLPESEFSQLTLQNQKPPHIVIYNPKPESNLLADVYLEISDRLWRKVDDKERKITLERFTDIVRSRRKD